MQSEAAQSWEALTIINGIKCWSNNRLDQLTGAVVFKEIQHWETKLINDLKVCLENPKANLVRQSEPQRWTTTTMHAKRQPKLVRATKTLMIRRKCLSREGLQISQGNDHNNKYYKPCRPLVSNEACVFLTESWQSGRKSAIE